MNRLNINKIVFAIALFIANSLQITAQTISETAETTTTVTVAGGEIFADPNDGTTGGIGGDCSSTSGSNSGNYPNCNCITVLR